MRWHPGTKVVRLASLVDEAGKPVVDSEDFKRRVTEPHVIALAASIKALGGQPASLPSVHWPKKGRPELVAGWDRTAALVVNGLKPRGVTEETDGQLEVRTFEGTPAEVNRLRRDENIHRRQDRDRWLREQVEEEARELAALRAEVSPEDMAEMVAETKALVERLGAERDARKLEVETGGGPLLTAAGPPPAELDPPDNVAQGVATDGGGWIPVKPPTDGPFYGEARKEPEPTRAAPTRAETTEARKRVAAREGVTPGAVRQAEHRDRKRTGEAKPAKRTKHDDTGAALTQEQLRTQRVYFDVEAHVDQAITRLANHIRKTPDAGLKVQLAGLRAWRDDFKAQRAREGL